MTYRLDEIDKRILYHLARDARRTTAREIAAEVDVSPGTIGNRIEKLEDQKIIEGYHATVNYEKAANLLTHLYICNAPSSERERLAREALEVPGVINVRRAMTGRENLHVMAVGKDTKDIGRLSQALTELGLKVEKEGLLEEEYFHPYHPYGPDSDPGQAGKSFMSLAGDAELTELRLLEEAPVVGVTIAEAATDGILSDDVLVVAIERGDSMVTPKGDAEFQRGDIVTLLFRNGIKDGVVKAFGGDVVHR
ncbi:DNA-binding transcriptional regulator, Lrp family [Halogranum rubrum]|uniref:DNA-binding transcriptional regulator, Lrp family n=1 Tax=Halogranum rubrum TaxID=553466 RepID=A0A1I4I2R3_9EURY|nr:Lrp/AsnC family transcriptional regulator [Halogranum rubrum]SFL48738.1 DNA-binding transcriptional regulator, Lrp family [Halogranum rubrum]